MTVNVFPTSKGFSVALTPHALKQMLQRHVSLGDLAVTLAQPEQTYVDTNHSVETRVVFQRDDLAVVVSPDTQHVITVLYRKGEQWSSSDGRPSGRVLSRGQRRKLVALLDRETGRRGK